MYGSFFLPPVSGKRILSNGNYFSRFIFLLPKNFGSSVFSFASIICLVLIFTYLKHTENPFLVTRASSNCLTFLFLSYSHFSHHLSTQTNPVFPPPFHTLSGFHLYLLYWNCFFKSTNGLLITKGGHINNPAWVAGITCATLLMSINHWLRATPRDVNSLELLVCLAPFKKAFRCWCLHLEACIKYAQRLSAESMGVSNNIWDSQASGQTWVIFWDEWIQTCCF